MNKRYFSRGISFAVIYLVFTMNASATTFTIPASTTVGGQPVSTNAVFTIYDGLGQIDIQLNNTQANPTSVIQALSGLSFVLSTGQTSGSLLSMSGTQRTINSDGSYSDGSTINSGWVLQTGSVLRLCVLCAGGTGPDYTLIGPEGADADSLYNNANGSIAGNGPHNPFFGDSLSFSLSVPGLTSDSAISSATFFFGTTEGQDFVTVGGCTVDCGGPTRTPQNTVPEPSTFILFGLALLGFSAWQRKQQG